MSFGAEGVLRSLRKLAIMDRGSWILIGLIGSGKQNQVALRRGLLVNIVEHYIVETESS